MEFEYHKYWENTTETRTVGPLLLKEFRGRWYLLGQMAYGRNRHLVCFGLDRIHDLRTTGQPFAPPVGFDAATYYAHAFGITRPRHDEPQQVLLRFGVEQGRYVLGYPLHPSQRVVLENNQEIQVALTVYDTHELRMEPLSYGPAVTVLNPPALAAWLRAQHLGALG